MTKPATPHQNSDRIESIGSGITSERLSGLRRWNLGLTVLHAVQAA